MCVDRLRFYVDGTVYRICAVAIVYGICAVGTIYGLCVVGSGYGVCVVAMVYGVSVCGNSLRFLDSVDSVQFVC